MGKAGKLVLGVVLAGLVVGNATGQDYSKNPVLMIHGYFLGETLTWASIESRLKDDGWPEGYLYKLDFANVVGCNPEHGMEIAAKVQDILATTGKSKIDIIAHSMGAIDTRYYIKYLCGYKYVQDVVMLAGANKGTTVACVEPFSCGAESMCVGFSDGDWKNNSFLLSLNSCDITPGEDLLYTSVWSGWDEIIIPAKNSEIEGALNHKLDDWPVGHGGILLNSEAYEWVRLGLDGGGTNNNAVDVGCEPYVVCEDPVEPGPEVVEPSVEPEPDVISEPEPEIVEEVSWDVHEIDLTPEITTPPDVSDIKGDTAIADQASTDVGPGDLSVDHALPDGQTEAGPQDTSGPSKDIGGPGDTKGPADAVVGGDTSGEDQEEVSTGSDTGSSAPRASGCLVSKSHAGAGGGLWIMMLLLGLCFCLMRNVRR